jgi:hypothetical protein
MQEVLGCMFKNIFDFHLRALRYFQASKWKQIFKAHVFRSKFADIIDDIRQHKELVERQADLIEFQEAKQARDDAQQHYEEHEAQEQLRRRLFMQDWLDAPNMAGQQEKGQLTREAQPRSGQWLLSRDKVKAWLDPAMSVAACLWIHGIPGAGKTVLASLLIDSSQTTSYRWHVRYLINYLIWKARSSICFTTWQRRERHASRLEKIRKSCYSYVLMLLELCTLSLTD